MASTSNPTCSARNARGEPCGAYAVDGSRFCFAHDPERAKERAEARKRGGRNRRTPKGSAPPATVALRSVPDVQRLLEGLALDTLRQENSDRRTRALVAVLGLALKALETGELEARLEALEARLNNPPRLEAA